MWRVMLNNHDAYTTLYFLYILTSFFLPGVITWQGLCWHIEQYLCFRCCRVGDKTRQGRVLQTLQYWSWKRSSNEIVWKFVRKSYLINLVNMLMHASSFFLLCHHNPTRYSLVIFKPYIYIQCRSSMLYGTTKKLEEKNWSPTIFQLSVVRWYCDSLLECLNS